MVLHSSPQDQMTVSSKSALSTSLGFRVVIAFKLSNLHRVFLYGSEAYMLEHLSLQSSRVYLWVGKIFLTLLITAHLSVDQCCHDVLDAADLDRADRAKLFKSRFIGTDHVDCPLILLVYIISVVYIFHNVPFLVYYFYRLKKER